MQTTLRLTDTNAGTDSQGKTWGLDGDLVWWLIGGLGTGIAVFFALILGFKVGLLTSVGGGLAPVVLVLVYVLTLRQGKPPGYDRDLVESLTQGRGFGPEFNPNLRHPLH